MKAGVPDAVNCHARPRATMSRKEVQGLSLSPNPEHKTLNQSLKVLNQTRREKHKKKKKLNKCIYIYTLNISPP